jgi:hypothetical protein
MTNRNYLKLTIAIIASVYFIGCCFNPGAWHFIDNANLLIHEGGHIIFMSFGDFMYALGGSLTQVLLPAIFVIYFAYREQYYSASLVLFWVGENLLNVSVYAGDAVKMQLPLLFGDNSTHDWNWLLIRAGMLHHTVGVAATIQFLGVATILIACAWAIYSAVRPEPEQLS